jgi:hypothetical protein
VQPEWRAWNPRHSEPNGWRKHSRDPKGPEVDVPRSNTQDVSLIRPFWSSVDTQYVFDNEAVQFHLAPSSSREASPDAIIQDAGEGGKKRHKQRRQETAPAVGDDSDNNK